MKSHIVLLRKILLELGGWCCTSTDSDWKTIEARLNDEGLSFITITLPQFAKDLQKGLERGKVDSTLFLSFRKRACLPAFLQGFTSLIFNPSTGILLDEPNIDAIYSIFQICNLFSKVEIPCSDARNRAAISKYVQTDLEVKLNDAKLDKDRFDLFKSTAWRLWGPVFSKVDKTIAEGLVIPKHGPGATAERVRGNAKFSHYSWTERLDEVFLSQDFLIPNWRYNSDHRVDIKEPGSETPVRVVTVPKTLKTPRIIAIEPVCMQYAQQGIWEQFLSEIESHDKLSVLVGFADQSLNQDMAKRGSRDGTLATLDLSEASDRVSNQLVRGMLQPWHWLASAVDATRSRKADIPGWGVKRLAKFASMGSALCFPIEAMVFMTIVALAIEKESGLPVADKELKSLVGKVRVYGDDIIVPVEYVHTVIEELEAFGLKVNSDKSFWTGKFRESCGREYYDDRDVSIVKVRRVFPTSPQDVQEIISIVSLRNQLFHAGLLDTVRWLDTVIEGLIPFPYVGEESPGLGRHGFDPIVGEKTCPSLQRPLVRAYREISVIPRNPISDDGALLKFFLKRGDEPFADKRHLERSGRPDAVSIKLGWVPAL